MPLVAIATSHGKHEVHACRSWKTKVEAVQQVPRSIAERRAVLVRMLELNGPAFRIIERHGAAADGRLAAQAKAGALPMTAE